MLSEHGRKPAAILVEPIAAAMLRLGATPNTVTVLGTLAAVGFALVLIPTGHLFAAAVLIGLTVATDMVDGTMARMRGGGTSFGATLDASCDRITDGAVFGALAFYLATHDVASPVVLAATLVVLVFSQVTSYVKARAEAGGIPVKGGLIERPERLIIGLVAIGLHGLGVPHVLAWGVLLLATGSFYTVFQRLLIVSRSDAALTPMSAPAGAREFPTASE